MHCRHKGGWGSSPPLPCPSVLDLEEVSMWKAGSRSSERNINLGKSRLIYWIGHRRPDFPSPAKALSSACNNPYTQRIHVIEANET